MAKQWSTPNTANVKFDVALNANGNIAQSGQEAAGKKSITLPGIKTDSDFTSDTAVYSAFYTGLAGGRYDEATGEKIIKMRAVEVEEP